MNRKQLTLLAITWTIVISIFSFFIFKEESVVLEKGIEVKEIEKVDVVDDGKKVSILSFEKSVEGINWINDNTIEFIGQKNTDDNKILYLFDLSNQVLTRAEQRRKVEEDSTRKIIKKIDESSFIFTEAEKSKGIYIYSNEEVITIADNALFEDKLKITISEKNNKIAYYDGKAQKIKIYGIDNRKTSTINVFPDEILLKSMDESIIFSPDGGYVVVYYSPETIPEKYFSVFGADSGRLYSEKIWAINPVWSPVDLKISYLYGENATKAIEEGKHLDYLGHRVGYYDLKLRKSIYIGAILNKTDIASNIKWVKNGNELGYHTGSLNEETSTWEIKGFNTYNLDSKSFSVYTNNFDDGLKLNGLKDWGFDTNYYTAVESVKETINLVINNRVLGVSDKIIDIELLPFKESNEYSKTFGEKLLYKKDKYLYLTDINEHEAIVTRDGETLSAVISPDSNNICVVSSVKGKMIIDIVNLKQTVPIQ